jgi:hypothetical protein
VTPVSLTDERLDTPVGAIQVTRAGSGPPIV